MPLIDINAVPKHIFKEFRSALARGDDWDTAALKASKDALVEFLIEAQGTRCAYCKRLIKDEIGHRELDHILPKNSVGKPKRAFSNAIADRRVTRGYLQFRFEPRNLVLTCKRCNHRKGNYDCRANRAAPIHLAYPVAAAEFEWIHPYHHDYDQHITIVNDFVYQEVIGSNGGAVIEACALDGIDALEARARDRRLKAIKDVNKLILELLLAGNPENDIVDSVALLMPAVSEERVRKLVRGFVDNKIS